MEAKSRNIHWVNVSLYEWTSSTVATAVASRSFCVRSPAINGNCKSTHLRRRINEKYYQNRIDIQFPRKRCFIHFREEEKKNESREKANVEKEEEVAEWKKIGSIKMFDVSNYDANCVALLHSALRLRKLRSFFFCVCLMYISRDLLALAIYPNTQAHNNFH